MRIKSICPMLMIAALSAFDAVAAPIMQPGQWEITTKMTMVGMPMEMPPQVFRHCYREDQLKDPKNAVPQDKDCKADSVSLKGNTVTWRANCKIDGEFMSGEGQITYAGAAYSGNAKLSGKVEGMAMQMNVNYSGKRLGDCSK